MKTEDNVKKNIKYKAPGSDFSPNLGKKFHTIDSAILSHKKNFHGKKVGVMHD